MTGQPIFFSSDRTTPKFLATPPVIITGALTPMRLAMTATRTAMDSWMPAMMFSLFSPLAISETTSYSANPVQRLEIVAG